MSCYLLACDRHGASLPPQRPDAPIMHSTTDNDAPMYTRPHATRTFTTGRRGWPTTRLGQRAHHAVIQWCALPRMGCPDQLVAPREVRGPRGYGLRLGSHRECDSLGVHTVEKPLMERRRDPPAAPWLADRHFDDHEGAPAVLPCELGRQLRVLDVGPPSGTGGEVVAVRETNQLLALARACTA